MSEKSAPNPHAPCDAHTTYLQRGYFAELDGLRALCALLVITAHLYSHKEYWVWLAGSRGVSVFFVLSGYLITTLALREEERRGRLSLAAFYVRRCCRLFPLYYVVLGVYCFILLGLGRGTLDQCGALAKALPWNLIYCQEIPFFRLLVLDQRDLPFFQGWSLGIEEKFYLIWPLLAFVLWRGRQERRIGGTCVLAAALAGISAVFAGMDPTFRVVGRFLHSFYPILIGCLAAFLLHDRAAFVRLRQLALWGAGVPPLLIFLIVHFVMPWTSGWLLEAVKILDPLATIGLLVPLLSGEGLAARLLRWRPLVFVGRLSYGVYLLHLLALGAVYRLLPAGSLHPAMSLVAFALASVFSIAGAWLLSLAVEIPGIRLGRHWSRRLTEWTTTGAPLPCRIKPLSYPFDPQQVLPKERLQFRSREHPGCRADGSDAAGADGASQTQTSLRIQAAQ
jgi:peptidoglycan/LPS O-acetylase OafA/YrhL